MANQKKRHMTDSDIQKKINRLLGGTLTEGEWNLLVKKYFIEEIRRDGETCIRAAKEVREWREATHSPKLDESEKEIDENKKVDMLSEDEVQASANRSVTISVIVAQEAREDAGVKQFRSQVLADKLLSPEEAREWIAQQVEADGPPTIWVTNIPLPSMDEEIMLKLTPERSPFTLGFPICRVELPTGQIIGHLGSQIHPLQYGRPDGWTDSVPTTFGGTLECLRQLSERLAESHKWTTAQATLFVLTDQTPFISPIVSTIVRKSTPLFSRIVLEIDPTLSPKEVTEEYRRLRKEFVATRYRNLSKKHRQLALFREQHSKRETWALMMAEWNKTQPPEWKYENSRNFAHDCLQARRRLLRSETKSKQ